VSLTNPANGAAFTAPATINLGAAAADMDGSVTNVAFYAGTTKLGDDTTSPYSLTWSNVAAASYSLTAVATDNSGLSTTSAPVSIIVSAQSGGATYSISASPTFWKYMQTNQSGRHQLADERLQ